jgi:hypothetical protein
VGTPLTVQIPGPISWAKFLLVSVLWLLVVFAFAGVTISFHKQWTPPANELKDHGNRADQCESLNFRPGTNAGTVLEPQNTWSNVFYLLAGMTILFCTCRPLGYVVGVQLCVLAFLSGMYHGTLQPDWQLMDVASIYFILWALILYAIQAVLIQDRPFRGIETPWIKASAEWSMALALAALSTWGGYQMAVHRSDLRLFGSTTVTFTFITAIIVICAFQAGRRYFDWVSVGQIWRLWTDKKSSPLEYLMFWRMFWRPKADTEWQLRSYFWAFAIVGGTAIFCRLNDGNGNLLCKADSVIQAHAVWHTFGAVVLLLGYDFLAWTSEWDWPVFVRGRPSPPTNEKGETLYEYKRFGEPVHVTAFTSIILGAGLFGLTFVPKAFLDVGDPPGSEIPTGLAIASVFILFGLTLLVLRTAGVIKKPNLER